MTKEKKHPKHRRIAKAVTSHPVYKKKKSASKVPHRYDMWEESVVGGLHIFEWIVVGVVSMIVFGIVAFAIRGTAGYQPTKCPGCAVTSSVTK